MRLMVRVYKEDTLFTLQAGFIRMSKTIRLNFNMVSELINYATDYLYTHIKPNNVGREGCLEKYQGWCHESAELNFSVAGPL
ncbi:hypothetical protein MTR_2g022340 [Medicago truncatula]|uniref:Uncharacterized protein n=1 Tax=Medicago truncatula TaxID=3880 RepID=A0A072V535_MEDTR|nr:hypothetical protein MTR_2g022340 [Medicago truncatula]